MVDDCQNSRVSKCLEQLKELPTNFRMVLLSSSLKVLPTTLYKTSFVPQVVHIVLFCSCRKIFLNTSICYLSSTLKKMGHLVFQMVFLLIQLAP